MGASWLLFFYSVPAKPVGGRMRIWRKLARIGAVQLKGAVYLLPDGEEQRENLQWLIKETVAIGGEAGFARAEAVQPFTVAELRALFNRRREEDYSRLDAKVQELRRRVAACRSGAGSSRVVALRKQFGKIRDELQSLRRLDFFDSPAGRNTVADFADLEAAFKRLLAPAGEAEARPEATLRCRDFRGRTWVTRPRPYVDRLASAWLIKRFIDPRATFLFKPEAEIKPVAGTDADGAVLSYDVAGGDFTHHHELCTFEVLLQRFGLTDDVGLGRLAEIVHDLDLNDDRYNHPAGPGLEALLQGLSSREISDHRLLARSFLLLDAFYAAQVRSGPQTGAS